MENYIERLTTILENPKLSPSVKERTKLQIEKLKDPDKDKNKSRRRSDVASFLFEYEPNLKPTSKF